MGIFKKDFKANDGVTDFEKAFINKKEKQNPIIKAGSIVLYVTVILAIFFCIIMAVLDKTGVAPSPSPEETTTTSAVSQTDEDTTGQKEEKPDKEQTNANSQ